MDMGEEFRIGQKPRIFFLILTIFYFFIFFVSFFCCCQFPEPYSKYPLAIYFTYDNVSFHVTLSIHLTLSSILPISIIYSLCLFFHCCPVICSLNQLTFHPLFLCLRHQSHTTKFTSLELLLFKIFSSENDKMSQLLEKMFENPLPEKNQYSEYIKSP